MVLGGPTIAMMAAASLLSGVAESVLQSGQLFKVQARGNTSSDYQSTDHGVAFLHVTFPEWLKKKAAEQEANPWHGQTIHQTNRRGERCYPGGEKKWWQEKEHIESE